MRPAAFQRLWKFLSVSFGICGAATLGRQYLQVKQYKARTNRNRPEEDKNHFALYQEIGTSGVYQLNTKGSGL
jgi:hypothetical protein